MVLDIGTNNEELLNDPLYLGMGHRRLEGEEYYSFVDEWVAAIQNRYPSKFSYQHASIAIITQSIPLTIARLALL